MMRLLLVARSILKALEFLDEVDFENRKFQRATSFKGCAFRKAPRFHNCLLHQNTDFTDAEFLDTASAGSAMAYRTLKLDMEEKRARQEQLRFYALEMKSRRHSEKRKFMKFISWMYGAMSDYGQRIFLPLAWLVYLFAAIYPLLRSKIQRTADLDAASIPSLAFHFSIKQIVRPFGVFSLFIGFWFLGENSTFKSPNPAPHHRGHASIVLEPRASAPHRPRGALALQDRVRKTGPMRDGPPRGLFPETGQVVITPPDVCSKITPPLRGSR